MDADCRRFALGASGVQIGTAYLFTPESLISDLHLRNVRDDQTALTNVFSGRPARVLNRVMREVGRSVRFRRRAARSEGGGGSGSILRRSGRDRAPLGREIGAGELTRTLAAEALDHIEKMSGRNSRVRCR